MTKTDGNARNSFTEIVIAIFSSQNFQIHRLRDAEDSGADLIARRGTDRVIIEVKAYRSSKVPFSSLRNAALQLNYARSRYENSSALIVTNAIISPEFQRRLLLEFEIAVYGQFELLALISSDVQLQLEFQNVLREMFTFDVNPSPSGLDASTSVPEEVEPESDETNEFLDPSADSDLISIEGGDEPQPSTGEFLCKRLRGIRAGRDQASDFEDICEEVLKYLFGDHLVGWNFQSETNTGLHIFDLIARISTDNSFWLTLSQQFRTRNPVFEFKNYTEPITQAQIYTTEKYLYPAALRGTAIIISREGYTENAKEAMRGALREAGKLILVLSLNEICLMLHAKDSGDEPSDQLAEKLDEMLFHLDR